MRVEIVKRLYFDDKERRKWRYFALRHNLTAYRIAKENHMTSQYVYSIIRGEVAITPRIKEMFEKYGYLISEDEQAKSEE